MGDESTRCTRPPFPFWGFVTPFSMGLLLLKSQEEAIKDFITIVVSFDESDVTELIKIIDVEVAGNPLGFCRLRDYDYTLVP
ncbi:MAG TPA: hypothetical protein IAA88_04665 [Candidatus Avimuribaculum pullicola]|nr:hypothetical protein [Candidatus Avimuribaculum pullicola]